MKFYSCTKAVPPKFSTWSIQYYCGTKMIKMLSISTTAFELLCVLNIGTWFLNLISLPPYLAGSQYVFNAFFIETAAQ